jgi:hypothetical protein
MCPSDQAAYSAGEDFASVRRAAIGFRDGGQESKHFGFRAGVDDDVTRRNSLKGIACTE